MNVSSVDNSTNIANVNEGVGEQIEALRKEIASLGLLPTEQAEALEVLDTEEQFAQGKPKRSVVMALLDSLPKVATVAVAVAKIAALF